MHMKGEPKTMQLEPRYGDVVREVRDFLAERAEFAVSAGVKPENVVVDPRHRFREDLDHNLTLLRDLDAIVDLGFPCSSGRRARGFWATITGVEAANERVFGTVATTLLAYERGATFFRVHDVRANREALAVAEVVRRA
jgi:dihydropteroate synthase